MGDSSGGCLTLQLLYLIKALNLPEPLGGVLISPFIDHDLKSESWHLNWNSDYLSLDIHGIAWAMSIYANGKTVTNPFVSPINLDLRGLPPLLIQVGDAEVVLNDSEKLHKRATDQGVLSELQVYRDMFHVFQGSVVSLQCRIVFTNRDAVFSYIPEAKEAVKRIGIFFKERRESFGADTDGSHPLGLQVNIRRTRSTYIEELDFVAKE